MKIENSEALKSWLTARLSRICDADPAALSKYVLALVKKDKSESELREFCLDSLDVFLASETEKFVDVLFGALKDKSYLTDIIENIGVPNPLCNDGLAITSSEVSDAGANKSPKCKKAENVHSDSGKKSKIINTSLKSKIKNFDRGSAEKLLKSKNREAFEDSCCKRSDIDDRKNSTNLFPSKRFHPSHLSNIVEKKKKVRNEKKERNSKFAGKNDVECSSSRSNSCDKIKPNSSSSRSREGSVEGEPDKSDLGSISTGCEERFLDHGDTDYRQKNISASDIYMKELSIPSDGGAIPFNCRSSANYINKVSERCKDYDERGYCMRGDLCQYDHGTDPILVENVNVLSFVATEDNFEDDSKSPHEIQPPPPPTSPPPLPPPPPPIPPGSFFSPEPYNPESPGMNVGLANHMNFFAPLSLPHHMPLPPLHAPSPNMMYSFHGTSENFHNSKPHRARELIGVPTVDSSSIKESFTSIIDVSNKKNGKYPDLSEKANKSSVVDNKEILKRKGFDYNRLGPTPRKVTRLHPSRKGNVLEIRKIPKHLNTITCLNSHFSKFGSIIKIKVCYDGDAEAALVEFSNHMEANSAYRSTDAVFNNRFIKVFWHSNNELANNSNSLPEIETEGIRTEDNHMEQTIPDKLLQRPISAYSKGKKNVPRNTLQSSLIVKKSSFPGNTQISIPLTRKFKEEEQKKETLKKRLTIHTTKQDFLKTQMEHQKIILEKLSRVKNTKEKEFLKITLQTMSEKIEELQNELKKDSEDLKNLLKSTFVPVVIVSKTTAEKELLDAELELYNKQHTGDDTAELLSKVNELKQKAKAFIDSCAIKTSSGIPKRKAAGNSVYSPKVISTLSHSVDHRPRSLLITGPFDIVTDKQDLIKHFLKFGDVENTTETEIGFIVSYCKRIEAELAYARGKKFGDNTLSIVWFQDTQVLDCAGSDIGDNSELETINMTSIADEDDEEEEGARSWRR